LARRTLLLLRHKNPLVAGNWDGSGSRVRKTLVNGDARRTLDRVRSGCGRLIRLSMLRRCNSLLMTCLTHKLATVHTSDVCSLILTPLLGIGLVLNAELDILTLNKVLVAVA
jgi:hypothetical protein